MRVLVTGADGYIGNGVVEQLLSMGHEVIAYGLNTCGVCAEGLEEHIENIFDLNVKCIAAHRADAVLHLAWRNGFKHNDISHIVDLPAHYVFIMRCLEAGIHRVACMGTMHEVGYHEGAVRADTPCWPTTPYAVAKNALRELVKSACSHEEAEFLWLRGFYLVSADARGNSVFSKLTIAAQEGKKTFPFTTGENKYDFLDYENFCKLTAQYLTDGTTGIVNICSGVPESLASRVERFIKENCLDIDLEYGVFPDRPYDSPAIWGELKNASAELKVNSSDGL